RRKKSARQTSKNHSRKSVLWEPAHASANRQGASAETTSLLARVDSSKQPSLFVVRTGAKVQNVLGTCLTVVAKSDTPQPVDDDGLSFGVLEVALRFEGHRIEHVDASVTEIADQQHVAEPAEAGRRHGHAPGGVQRIA